MSDVFLISLIYDYCSKVPNIPSRKGPANRLTTAGTKHEGQIGGEDLYLHIKDYLTNNVRKILQVRQISIFFQNLSLNIHFRMEKIYKVIMSFYSMVIIGIDIYFPVKSSMAFVCI